MKNTYINEEIYKYLLGKYNKLALNKEELAHELGVSVSAINNCIVRGYGLPNFKKNHGSKNGRVFFPLICIAEYLSNTVKVA
jgi:putative hemolysin